METEERVRALGTPALIDIFDNMFLEDFCQEYECSWSEESTAWINWADIQACQDPELLFWQVRSPGDLPEAIAAIRQEQANGNVEGVLFGGIDIGRHHDLTELILLGQTTSGQLVTRLNLTLANVPFDDQQGMLRTIIDELRPRMVFVDDTGIGAMLAENLAKTKRAEGRTFTQSAKEEWAIESRMRFERRSLAIPADRDLAYQIHSIKRRVVGNAMSFDAERNEKGHADKYWALALAIAASARKRGMLFG
jgi:phage FluMu gp28-like protein